MDFNSINKVSKVTEFLPWKKLSELTPEAHYPITDLRTTQTKFGRGYAMDIDTEFSVFLPTRLVKLFDADIPAFEKIQEAARDGHLYIQFLGGKYNSFEFKWDISC